MNPEKIIVYEATTKGEGRRRLSRLSVFPLAIAASREIISTSRPTSFFTIIIFHTIEAQA